MNNYNSFMNCYDVLGYVYEGGVHCEHCTEKRFPKFKGIDREGNSIGPYSVSDAIESDRDTSCDDCHELIFEADTNEEE